MNHLVLEDGHSRRIGPRRIAAVGRPDRRAATRLGDQMFAKPRNIAPEDRPKLKSAGDQERKVILKKAGFTDEGLPASEQMRKQNDSASRPGSSRRKTGPRP
jgi:hypothetical protein